MLDWILTRVLGGKSKRFRMTLLYTLIFVVLSLARAIEPISFGTFSGLFGVWIVADTKRK